MNCAACAAGFRGRLAARNRPHDSPAAHIPGFIFMTVTIKNAEEQEKMRVAGRLAAEVLDMIGEHVQAGVTHQRTGPDLPSLYHRSSGRHSGAAELPRLSQIHLHLGQSRGLPRHSGRSRAQKRRFPQYRHHGHQGRLSRRHQPDVSCGQAHGHRQPRQRRRS